MQRYTREFGDFRRDCRALAAWLAEIGVELVVMESTGIYWKSVHAHLENAGIAAWVVNAHRRLISGFTVTLQFSGLRRPSAGMKG